MNGTAEMTGHQRGEATRIEARYGPVRVHPLADGLVDVELLNHTSKAVLDVENGNRTRYITVPVPAPRLRLNARGAIVAGQLEHPFDFGASRRGQQALMEQRAA